MRNCIDEATLQAWFDGELAADEASNVMTHLGRCFHCAEAARALEAENLVLSEGLSTEFAAAIPTERLRQRIDAAVVEIHRAPVGSAREARRRLGSEFFASFRPLVYASIAGILLLGAFVAFIYLKKEKAPAPVTAKENPVQTIPITPKEPGERLPTPVPSKSPQILARRTTPVRRTSPPEPDATSLSWQEHQYQYAITQLNEAIKIEPMRPSIRVEYEYDMALIDYTIATTREAARKNTKDPQATQAMLDAYQSKINLMNQIANARDGDR